MQSHLGQQTCSDCSRRHVCFFDASAAAINKTRLSTFNIIKRMETAAITGYRVEKVKFCTFSNVIFVLSHQISLQRDPIPQSIAKASAPLRDIVNVDLARGQPTVKKSAKPMMSLPTHPSQRAPNPSQMTLGSTLKSSMLEWPLKIGQLTVQQDVKNIGRVCLALYLACLHAKYIDCRCNSTTESSLLSASDATPSRIAIL